MNAEPEFVRYFLSTLNSGESSALLQKIIAHHQKNESSLFAPHLNDSNAFAGWCGLMKVPFSARFAAAVEMLEASQELLG